MANAVSVNGYEGGGASGSGSARAPRLPRWTRGEMLVLIQGKRVVEGRGRRRGAAAAGVEPKWAAVSAYCRRHGVERGAVQCRKRWSNLAGDFKKIKEWERAKGGGKESFWAMRNDLRRERRLPGFFDREVYDILDGTAPVPVPAEDSGRIEVAAVEDEEEAVFDSGRAAGDEGLFSDCEEEKEADEEEEMAAEEEEEERPPPPPPPPPAIAGEAVAATPISEKYIPLQQESADPAPTNEGPPTDNPEKGSSSWEGQKRKRTSEEGLGEASVQHQLLEVLERNSRMLTAQLEVQNINCQLDREQRKDHANSLLGVLGKLADALGRIADKL